SLTKTKTETKLMSNQPKSNPMKLITRVSLLAAFGLATVAMTACKKETSTETSAAADPRIEAVFVESAPQGAVSILEARKKVEPGATVTSSGRIAGAMAPFSKDYATLVLADESLMTCEKN